METTLKILILEDSTIDAEIIQRLLIKEKMLCEFHLAAGKTAFIKALDEFIPDVILSDHSLPKFNSSDALAAARQKLPNVPFIMVTGAVSEEFAVNIIKQGADDYILKDRMARLPAAIRTALEQRRAAKEITDYKYALDESAIVAITDQKGIILYANENFCKISKYTAKELIGQDHRIINSGHHNPDYMKDLWRTIAHGDIWRGEFCNRAKDGSIYWVESTIIPFLDEKRKPYQYLAIRYDITEKKNIEDQLTQSEIKYRTIFLKSPLPTWIYDCETLAFLDVNEAAIKHYGFTKKEFLSMTIKDIRPREELQLLMNDLALITNNSDYRQGGNWRHRKKNGEMITVETTAHFIEYNNRKARMVIANDITEKIAAEKQKEFDANNLKALINNTHDLMWSVDKDLKLINCNEAFNHVIEMMSGKPLAKGQDMLSIQFPPEQQYRYKVFYQRALSGESFTITDFFEGPVEIWTEISFYPIWQQDAVIGTACFSRDITEKIKSQQELQAAYNRLSFHIENAPLGFIEWDNQLNVKSWSKYAEEIFGWSEKEFILQQKNGYGQVYEEDLPLATMIAEQLITGATERNSVQHRNYTKDGRVIWCEWFNSVLKEKNGKVITILSLVQDITERKNAEENLRKSEMRLNEAQSIAHISNYEVDLLKGVHTWSDEFYSIFGISKEEVTPSFDLFISFIHPDDAEAAKEKITGILQRYESASLNFRFIRKDNKTRHAHSEWKFEFDKSGKPIRLFGIMQDITEQKEAEENLNLLEKKILEQRIQEQKKVARAIIKGQEKERNHIGKELHDNINQILAGTKIYLGIAGKKSEEVKEIIKYPMELIDSSIEEIRLLCAKLVTPVKNVNLEDLIRDLTHKISQDETIKTGYIYAVPDKLISDDLKLNIYRIIQELANNILKYAQAKTVNIVIETRDNNIQMVVEDDGKGFDLSSKRNGIGISNIINRAETFNGTVEIITSPGKGCKTIVTIPW